MLTELRLRSIFHLEGQHTWVVRRICILSHILNVFIGDPQEIVWVLGNPRWQLSLLCFNLLRKEAGRLFLLILSYPPWWQPCSPGPGTRAAQLCYAHHLREKPGAFCIKNTGPGSKRTRSEPVKPEPLRWIFKWIVSSQSWHYTQITYYI